MPLASLNSIKEIIGQCIDSLSDVYRLKPETSAEELLNLMEKLQAETGILPVQIKEVTEKCGCASGSHCPLVKDLKKQFNAWEVQLQRVSGKQELKDLSNPVHYYINQFQQNYYTIRPFLPKKSKPGSPPNQTNYYIQDSDVTINNYPESAVAVNRESSAAEATGAAETAAASSVEATTPAGSTLEGDGLPSFSFRLPKAYGHMLNSQEKDRYYRVQEFIALERARGVNDDYDLFSFKQCMALATFEGLHVIGEKHTRENPGRHLAEIFGGNVKDAKNYVLLYKNPYAKVSDKYLLKGEYPKLEAAYVAWLETR